jgi:hypothetical protein
MIARFRKKTPAVLAGLAMVALLTTPAAAQAPTSPLTGVVTGTTNVAGEVFNGTIALTNFVLQDGVLAARATLTGTVTNATGGTVRTITGLITVPITVVPPPPGVCQILTLDVGEIHLDLLGLNIDTSQIVVLVTAVSGQGRLLGNLLCAVAGLLDSPSALEDLLDRILRILNGL